MPPSPVKAELLRQEYLSRINRVIDRIYAEPGREFSLEELAGIACFSAFHFHRLFSALVGETLSDFIRRVRLERAAANLVDHPRDSVTDIALACGFSSPSVFARSFKERFGCSASQWREGAWARRGKDCKEDGKGGEAPLPEKPYHLEYGSQSGKEMRMEKLEYRVEVRELPAMTVAYVRHVGEFNGIGEAFSRLGRWAGPRGFMGPNARVLAVYHDSPEITEASKLRSSACVQVPAGTKADGEIGIMEVPGGSFAVGRFEIAPEQFGAAWDALMGEWLPSSGYQPDDRMCYEIYLNSPGEDPRGYFIIDICEPVKPL